MIGKKERIFWKYEDACDFADKVNETVEVKFWDFDQKDYVVKWYVVRWFE